MAGTSDLRIYRLFGVCALLVVTSFIAPRFVPNTEGGFASGASAVLVLLLLLFVAFLVSLFLLAVTIRSFAQLSTKARVVGLVPSIVLVVGLAGLMIFLRY